MAPKSSSGAAAGPILLGLSLLLPACGDAGDGAETAASATDTTGDDTAAPSTTDAPSGTTDTPSGTTGDDATTDDMSGSTDGGESSTGSDEPEELKAFPSAYGAGAYTTGGRGGTVYHVTSLLDDGSEGTLRWALDQPRPSTIVFDVSGTIDLQSWLTLSGSDVTIAGQTAPEGGITITSTQTQRIRAQDLSNVIIRYLRIRPLESGDDSFEIYGNNDGGHDIILDHISASYGGDETISVRGADTYNITFQRCLFAEGKTGSLFGDTNSPEFSHDNSYLHSLFFNISHRTPNISSDGRVDVVNNVIQNWQYRLTYAHGNSQLNQINNYYAMGEREGLVSGTQNQINTLNSSFDHQIYTAGNIIDKGIFADPEGDNRVLWAESESGEQTTLAPASEFTDQPYPLLGPSMQVLTAAEALQDVVGDVGANASLNADGSVTFYTDRNDTDYLAVMAQGEGAYEAYEMYGDVRSWFGEQRYADFVDSISSTPLAVRPDDYDTDRDGMGDAWEMAQFGSLERDGRGDLDEDGYTDLEEFLNQVDG